MDYSRPNPPHVDRYLALILAHLAHGAHSLSDPSPTHAALEEAAASLSEDELARAQALADPLLLDQAAAEFNTGHAGLDALLSSTVDIASRPSRRATMSWMASLGEVLADLPTPDDSHAIAAPESRDYSLEIKTLACPDELNGDVVGSAQARSVPDEVIGLAFRQVLSDPLVGWRKNDKSEFMPMVVDLLAHEPAIPPGNEAWGRAFLTVLRSPGHSWQDTSAQPFIRQVARAAAAIDFDHR